MTLAAECRRCHRPFEPTGKFGIRIVCPECLGPKMALERQRPDCPDCGCERTQASSHHFSILCMNCRMERRRESSRLNHSAARLAMPPRSPASPENPAQPPVIDGEAENLRTSTLRLGQALTARGPRAEAAAADATTDAYVPDDSTDSNSQGGSES